MGSAETLRHHLRFDVRRLQSAALRLQSVDATLRSLKDRLQERAVRLTAEAGGEPCAPAGDEEDWEHPVALRTAQAQAMADLARRATLREVLRQAGALSLVATMAVARWIEALVLSTEEGAEGDLARRQAQAKGHIDAGRIAHRMLATLRSRAGLRSGCGQLVCAVVVAEMTPPDLAEFLNEEIEEGYTRALNARGVDDEAGVLTAASAALREGARLLERMAARAEPAAQVLLDKAQTLESDVARSIRGP